MSKTVTFTNAIIEAARYAIESNEGTDGAAESLVVAERCRSKGMFKLAATNALVSLGYSAGFDSESFKYSDAEYQNYSDLNA